MVCEDRYGIDMKTIVVTGASGNLGGQLVERLLLETNWNIVTFSSSTISKWEGEDRIKQYRNNQIRQILPDIKADALVHLAFARRFRSNTDIATSIDFSEQVFKAAYANPSCRVVNISTVGVYAPSDDFIDESAPVGPDSLYGMAKYASEVLLNSVFEDSRERITNLRLGGVAQSQRLIPVFIENAIANHQINIVGGTQQFSWIDIEDAISAMVAILHVEKWKPIYNVTLNKERYLITDIANMVADHAKALGYGDVTISVESKDIHLCVGWNSESFMNDSKWHPQVSIAETVRKMFPRQK